MQQPDVLQAKRVLLAQLALTLVLTVAAAPFGASIALSVLVGSSACLLATAVFAVRMFQGYRAQAPGSLLMRIYGAEAAKLALVLGLFGAAFATIEGLNLPALFAAYLAVQVLPAIVASQWGAGLKPER